jgi:hypothetical protein
MLSSVILSIILHFKLSLFNSSIDFGTMEEVGADNTTIIKHIPIPEIIRNMIH